MAKAMNVAVETGAWAPDSWQRLPALQQPVYRDPLTEITDQLGVRVVTYLHEDVDAVAGLLAEQFTVLDDRDMGQETAEQGRFGYASRHVLVAVDPVKGVPAAYDTLRGRSASVRTTLLPSKAKSPMRYRLPSSTGMRSCTQRVFPSSESSMYFISGWPTRAVT